MDKPLISQKIKDRFVIAIIKDGHKVGSKTFIFKNKYDIHPKSKMMGYIVGYIEGIQAIGYEILVED